MNDEVKKTDINHVLKSASVQSQEVTDEELKLINKLTLNPLTKEEVFTFKVAMCDNEIDRDFEVFTLKTLQDLKKLFVGKTVIKDHMHMANNQVARIYSTELIQDGSKTTKNGELYTKLVAHCYMLNSENNQNLIADIKGGIKKEVSVGCACTSIICSICGVDNRKEYCKHYWGKEYDGKICYFKLENAKDAYELSFVAVPAQPKAGTIKQYGAEYKNFEKNESQPENSSIEENITDISNKEIDTEKIKEFNLNVKLIETMEFIKNKESESNE